MGRRPKSPKAVPHLRARKRGAKVWYYYDHGGKPRKETPLGCDYGLAIKKWAEIEHETQAPVRAVITFRWAADQYRQHVIPGKAPRTQIDNAAEIAKLIEFFDDPPAPLDAIEPQHVRQYMTWRGQTAKSRANREKATLSAIWNFARERGYTSLPNPCTGIRGFTEKGREAYIDDSMYQAVWDAGCQPLRDAMDLAYLTGQRPADVLKMSEGDIRDGSVDVAQGKTRAKLRIEVVGELQQVIERIKLRKHACPIYSTRLVVNERGRPLSLQALQDRFAKARAAAKVAPEAFQFRDLRAKAGSDKADSSGDMREAQRQLGHTSITMTEHYIRSRRGQKVSPTK